MTAERRRLTAALPYSTMEAAVIGMTRRLAVELAPYGITVNANDLKAKNVAAVMLTSEISAFLKPGARIDVNVASMGDAKSLQGGVLLLHLRPLHRMIRRLLLKRNPSIE